jgi:hypothetical protein
MKNYEEMSDYEINAAVTNVTYQCDGWELNWTNGCFFHCGVDGSGYYKQTIHNYCNNPSDAWPVIVDNKIGVQFFGDAWMSFVHNVASRHFSYDEKPLRAAMICFLKMKDSEQ